MSLGSDRVPSGLTKIGEVSATHPVWRLGGAAWVLALGTNDVGHTATSIERVDAEVDRAVAAVGFRRGLWWVNVGTARVEPWSTYEVVWNARLDLDGRFGVVDWHAASSGRREYFISDLVHLTPLGYEVRSDLLVADLAVG